MNYPKKIVKSKLTKLLARPHHPCVHRRVVAALVVDHEHALLRLLPRLRVRQRVLDLPEVREHVPPRRPEHEPREPILI